MDKAMNKKQLDDPELSPEIKDTISELKKRVQMEKSNMLEEQSPESAMWSDLLETYRKLKESNPSDRSEKARRMAVAITKYEDLLSWYYTMVLMDFEG